MAQPRRAGLSKVGVNQVWFAMGLGWSGTEPGLLEDATAAFIVRVWIEPREIADAPVTWRGSIEHVASSETKYMTNLDDLARFIRRFLEAMGVDFGETAK